MNEERISIKSPSQVTNLGRFIGLGLFFWLVIPMFLILWRWLVTKSTTYTLTTERLITKYGVLNKSSDQMELYRIRDFQVEEPFFLRLFGLGNIVMETSDKSHPILYLEAIDNPEEYAQILRRQVEMCRKVKGVREVDVT